MTEATTAAALTIRIAMVPASCLLPNAQRRTHYREWGEAAKQLRRAVGLIGFQARKDAGFPPTITGNVRVNAVIAWPKGRKTCDYQAACHALKAAVDGLEDACAIQDDRQVIGMDITQVRADKDDPFGYVELTLETA